MDKDIIPRNDKDERHGYCERCYDNGRLYYKGVYVNGNAHGYFEVYNRNGSIDETYTGYRMSGEKVNRYNEEGYCYICDKKELY